MKRMKHKEKKIELVRRFCSANFYDTKTSLALTLEIPP